MHLKPIALRSYPEDGEGHPPLLRKQKGFQDEITFVGQGGTEAFAISLWTKQRMLGLTQRNLPRSDEILATVVEELLS